MLEAYPNQNHMNVLLTFIPNTSYTVYFYLNFTIRTNLVQKIEYMPKRFYCNAIT